MKIYNNLGIEILDVAVTDDSYRYRAIMGENALTIMFSMVSYIDIPVGSYVDYQASRYTLLKPQNFTKNNTRDFEYTLILDGPEAVLSWFKLRDFSGRLKFSYTAKPQEHLQLLVDNLNERDSGWSVGSYVDSVEKVISFNHTSCNDALRQMAEAFNTEYEIIGKQISLRRVEYNKDNPLALSYGFGNGFKSGVKRENSGDSKAIEILYVQGGERNINPTIYGSQELLLPNSKTLKFDGSKFEGEAGFVLSASREYVSSADGAFIKRNDKPLSNKIEDSLDCSNIYPSRVGVVSGVEEISSAQNFYDILDNQIPATLDYHECLIEGEKMTIVFQSGMLAGREFDCSYVHNDRRFKIVPQEIDGMIMPSGSYLPQIGDSYAIFGIQLPTDYISNNSTKTGASWDMFREAVRYMYSNEESKFTFSGELDQVWASTDWVNIGGKIKLGGFVSFTDSQFQTTPALIRIVGVRDYINNPHKPQIELSNVTSGGGYGSALKDIANTETIIENAKKEVVRFAKRGFREAKETAKMLENSLLNFSGAINPVTVQTMQLLVGDESLQFEFVSNQNSTAPIPHNETFNPATKQFTSAAGIIQHKTLGITDVSSSRTPSDYKWWSLPEYISAVLDQQEKSYYLYAKVGKTNNAGTFLLSETAISIEQVSGFYHLLVGILNSESDGDRSYSSMYGYSELTPGRLMIKKLISPSGNVYFDLDKGNGDGEIGGNIKFRSTSGALKTVEQAIDEVEVGGRNLIVKSKISSYAPYSTTPTFSGDTLSTTKVGSASQTVAIQRAGVVFSGVHTNSGFIKLNGNPMPESMFTRGCFSTNNSELLYFSYDSNTGRFVVSENYSSALTWILHRPFIGIIAGDIISIENWKFEKGNKPTDYSPAPEDVQSAINTAQNAANTANQSVSSLNTYVDGAFKDGVIDSAEAKAIEKYINTVNTEYDNAISSYNVVANNSYLEGTPKTTLINEKETLAGAKDSLMSAISTAIADGKTTVSEKAAVDAAYASYKSAFGSYSTALENANKAIQQKLDSLSTDKVSNLKLGGRNYFLNGKSIVKSLTTSSDKFQYLGFPASTKMTVSFYAKVNSGSGVSLHTEFWGGVGAKNFTIGSSFTKCEATMTTHATRTGLYFWMNDANAIVEFKEIMVVSGDKAFDWTPAPEDIQLQIAETNSYIEAVESDLQNQIDGQIIAWFKEYNPTLINEPASLWATDDDRNRHANDTFTNTLTGASWRWQYVGGAWQWGVIADTATQQALLAASKAQDTADSKRRTFTAQPLTSQAYDVGDLWVNATVGSFTNDLLKCKTAKAVGVAFNVAHWEKASKYTDDTAVQNLKPAGKNYLIGSRTDSLVGWGAYGGTMSVVTDAQYGKVVEYSRPAGGSDFMKAFQIDVSELKNTELVYYCIAKPISGTTIFNYGGWQETFTMLNNNSPYRDLGNGWRLYYKVFTAGSAIASGVTFGLNSVGGTWRFHSFGVAKGNTPPSDWDASPKEIDFLKQGYKASTDIEGGVVQTAVLLLRNALEQVTAGISGLSGDNVINWGAGTYQDAINDAAKAFGAAMVTSFLNKDDGGGHLAFGKIAWNNTGQLIVDGIIKAIGGKLGLFDILNGSIIGRDSTGIERINISNKSIATTPAGLASGYIAAYDYQDGAVFNGNFYDYGQGDSNTYAQGVLVTNSFHLPTGSNILFGTGFSLYPFSNQSAVINYNLTTNAKIYLNGSFIGTAVDNVPFYVNGAGTVIVEEWFYLSASIVEGASTDYEIGIAGTGIGFYQATTAKSAMGQNGLYSYWNANKYLYFSEQFGLSVRGATDIPAGLGGGNVGSGGGITNRWGLAVSSTRSSGTTTIKHNVTDTKFTVDLTPRSSFTWYLSSITPASSPTNNDGNIVIVCSSTTAVFDFTIKRTPY